MKLITELKRIFVRQHGEDDCGLACLAMVLNYAGEVDASRQIMTEMSSAEGLGLNELRNIAGDYGLKSRAVEMEVDYLRTLKHPCIIHTEPEDGAGHYQVFYGMQSGRFVLADPANQVYTVDEAVLMRSWKSRAALYFEELPKNLAGFKRSNWSIFFSLVSVPLPLLIVMALLTGVSAVFGISLSWFFQKTNVNSAMLNPSTVAVLIILLAFIGIFKAVLNFARQRTLMIFNVKCNEELLTRYLGAIFRGAGSNAVAPRVKDSLTDLQKVQNAASVFIATFVGDGAMIILMLAITMAYLPAAGLVILTGIVVIGYLNHRRVPFFHYQMQETNRMSGNLETAIKRDLGRFDQLHHAGILDQCVSRHQQRASVMRNAAASFAIRSLKFLLLTDLLGMGMVITVIILAILFYLSGTIYFETVVLCSLLTFLITNLLARICSAIEIIDSGADAAVQLLRVLQ
ncbi:ABC transporter transmembrane protein [Mucilaginibacter yixingensis]|uniref:ABC transporter transmembrane protein n=1 Tax=Mucilaginibacter yixingensis TaxID=1295612 RepID=A0A2T5J4I5_9SPHI|nr:cysteine peptidase family C39 domain-containing protein [Mucilaginibacter yixingensis]PTQ92142.1 ABC transporter transmembrane protein [Mucilaginibacter yixingensis]